jgi:CMP-N-acetylneuraminic acid synthetase
MATGIWPPNFENVGDGSYLRSFLSSSEKWDNPEEFFHDAGQWYWGKLETWISQAPLLENSIGVPVSRWVAQDIDTIEDWKQAELLSRLI